MIHFKSPQPTDQGWVNACLQRANERGCEYNFNSLFVWQKAVQQVSAAQVGDFFVEQLCDSQGYSYLYPVGGTDIRGMINTLTEEAKAHGEPLQLVGITPTHIEVLNTLFPGEFEYTANRAYFDYLYEIDRLADLSGKKLHAKRNHINRFIQEHPDWVFEEITPENLSECLAMDEQWQRLYRGFVGEESLSTDEIALRLAIKYYWVLGLDGGLIRISGQIVAFAMGSPLSGDTYDIQFEKAFSTIQGAYAIINREFARWIRQKYPHIRYLNREDDMGVEGLRKAKESYYPDLMVEKHSAIRRGGQNHD